MRVVPARCGGNGSPSVGGLPAEVGECNFPLPGLTLAPPRLVGEPGGGVFEDPCVEERSQQALAVFRVGAKDLLESALGKQDHLLELRRAQAEEVVDHGR